MAGKAGRVTGFSYTGGQLPVHSRKPKKNESSASESDEGTSSARAQSAARRGLEASESLFAGMSPEVQQALQGLEGKNIEEALRILIILKIGKDLESTLENNSNPLEAGHATIEAMLETIKSLNTLVIDAMKDLSSAGTKVTAAAISASQPASLPSRRPLTSPAVHTPSFRQLDQARLPDDMSVSTVLAGIEDAAHAGVHVDDTGSDTDSPPSSRKRESFRAPQFSSPTAAATFDPDSFDIRAIGDALAYQAKAQRAAQSQSPPRRDLGVERRSIEEIDVALAMTNDRLNAAQKRQEASGRELSAATKALRTAEKAKSAVDDVAALDEDGF